MPHISIPNSTQPAKLPWYNVTQLVEHLPRKQCHGFESHPGFSHRKSPTALGVLPCLSCTFFIKGRHVYYSTMYSTYMYMVLAISYMYFNDRSDLNSLQLRCSRYFSGIRILRILQSITLHVKSTCTCVHIHTYIIYIRTGHVYIVHEHTYMSIRVHTHAYMYVITKCVGWAYGQQSYMFTCLPNLHVVLGYRNMRWILLTVQGASKQVIILTHILSCDYSW